MRLGALILLLAVPAAAEPAGMQATLSCRAEPAPGRVLCDLTYAATAGAKLAWVDALVTETPDFVRPLRSRVAPERFQKQPEAGERRLSLAFVAAKSGVGQVTVRARAVVCRGEGRDQRCRPETHDARAEIRVGS